jgi:rSAM/selenodomain-associated transferase 2
MKLTVVVPTLNEAAHLKTSLDSLPSDADVVVADGGSTDETVSIAERSGAHVVESDKGRARQMNRGAEAAHGDALLFLHADCTLGPTAFACIDTALGNDTVVGGSFRLRIRNASRGLRIIAATSNARARFLRTHYGDQAIFVRKKTFDELGGFPDIPFMEDVALVRKLKRAGKLVLVDETVTTGARHWSRLGPAGTTLLNWSMVILYLLGVPAEELEPVYRRLRVDPESAHPAKRIVSASDGGASRTKL